MASSSAGKGLPKARIVAGLDHDWYVSTLLCFTNGLCMEDHLERGGQLSTHRSIRWVRLQDSSTILGSRSVPMPASTGNVGLFLEL